MQFCSATLSCNFIVGGILSCNFIVGAVLSSNFIVGVQFQAAIFSWCNFELQFLVVAILSCNRNYIHKPQSLLSVN